MLFAMTANSPGTSTRRLRVAALILGFVGLALAASSMRASAQSAYAPQSSWSQRETPAAALARHIRVLAKTPRDFTALIGAGKAALALGDSQAAVGFFGRADEVYPASPLPQAGMGAAMVADGDASAALRHFARARELGANAAMLGADRGLAYDLLGQHSNAQADYRAALNGADGDEARRRLALSLAITGDKSGAIETLAPLMARGDAGAARCRALVLALSGDVEGARRSLDAAMPGSAVRMAPFFAKLPSLRSDQKAAAVNLGIFPDSSPPSYAYVTPQASPPARGAASSNVAGAMPMSGDRMASIDHLLREPEARSADEGSSQRPVQVASIPPRARSTGAGSTASATGRSRIWVQLASGSYPDALPDQFRRMKSRNRELFSGISGYIAEGAGRSRLLIGPFKSVSDANIFVEDLESVRVDAFSWTSPPGQMIRKLPTE
jgi:Flp pilus assembly protein TadD